MLDAIERGVTHNQRAVVCYWTRDQFLMAYNDTTDGVSSTAGTSNYRLVTSNLTAAQRIDSDHTRQ